MKRWIAIILAVMMLVGIMPGFVVPGSAAEEAVYVRTALKDLKNGDKFIIVQENYSVAVTAPGGYGSYCYVEEVDIIDGRITNPCEEAVWELDMISRDSKSVVGSFLQNGGALSRYTDYVWPAPNSSPLDWPVEPDYDHFNMYGPYNTWRLTPRGSDEYECTIENVEVPTDMALFDSHYYDTEWVGDPYYVVGVGVYDVGWRRSNFVIYVLEGAEYKENTFVPVSIWELRDGDEIMIVDESHGFALTEPAYSGSYIHPINVEIVDGKIINPTKRVIWEFVLLSEGSSYIEGAFYRDGKALSKKSDTNWTPGPDFDPGVDLPPDPTYDYFTMNGNYPAWKLEMSRNAIRACTITNAHMGNEICVRDINYDYSNPMFDCAKEYVMACGPFECDLWEWDLDLVIYAKRDLAVEAERAMKHTLNLESDISLRLWVDKGMIEKNHIDPDLMSIEYTLFDSVAGTATERSGKVSDHEEYGDYYVFTIDGLTAVDMNATIKSTLFGTTYDDAVVELCTDVYSIVTYAFSQMDKAHSSQKLKTVCADLLRYGAKAQIYKGYHENELADAKMWSKYRNFLSKIDAVTFGNTDVVLNDLEDAPIPWVGKSLNLGSKVALKFAFDPTEYAGDVSALTLKVSYRDIKNEEKTVVVEAPELYNEENGFYTFTVDCLLATELRTVVSAQIFAGDTPVSSTLQYSADTYGNGREGALLDLCKALFAYSDSAKIFFD